MEDCLAFQSACFCRYRTHDYIMASPLSMYLVLVVLNSNVPFSWRVSRQTVDRCFWLKRQKPGHAHFLPEDRNYSKSTLVGKGSFVGGCGGAHKSIPQPHCGSSLLRSSMARSLFATAAWTLRDMFLARFPDLQKASCHHGSGFS